MLSTSSSTSSLASVYYDARDTFIEAETNTTKKVSIFTNVKNKISNTTNFCFSKVQPVIEQLFVAMQNKLLAVIQNKINLCIDVIIAKIELLILYIAAAAIATSMVFIDNIFR